MKFKHSIEELKAKYLGKSFNDLTIIDVVCINSIFMFTCKCTCGTIKNIRYDHVIHGGTKSCGHRKSTSAPDKIRLWRRQHPDKVSEIALHIKEWNNRNKDILIKRDQANSDLYKRLRTTSDLSMLLDILHPDYVSDLLNGNLDTRSVIKTKCPICGCYCEHTLNNVFRIKTGTLKYGRAPCCHNCRPVCYSSAGEDTLYNFILGFYSGSCVRHFRDLIYPYELDLYYPDKNIAVEFNGDYWHSIQFGKSKDYHYKKFMRCLNKGVTLVSVFEHEWAYNSKLICEYIVDLFNGVENKISTPTEIPGYINNNYPLPNMQLILGEYVPNSYTVNKYTVFTCGYSKRR